ncbi:hypothetical protein [Shewanella frigidimarina]|uniref:hypothetical protein n=1 Tax=Shewanella frigidimarina TaxID=56812 RepID=UPI003D7C030B
MNIIETKQYSTVETLIRLLRYREIMFWVIEAADKNRISAIREVEFLQLVAQYQQGMSTDVAKEIALVFDYNNLLQANILFDRKSLSGVTHLWFNTNVIDIFRLCKISLYRPLTQTSLNASMTPIWSILSELEDQHLSVSMHSDEYFEWTDEVNHRIAEMLGKIKSNISKLERIGEEFELSVKSNNAEENLDITKEKYRRAAKLYSSEIRPLSIFLNKNTRYEKGLGIIMTLNRFQNIFRGIGDAGAESLMLKSQLQYLDLFDPIKKVSDSVSVYLQKTKAAIIEHNAIESAFDFIRQAYEKTLSGDQRAKYIKSADLVRLGPVHPIASLGRLSPFRVEKTPEFLNNVFNELATRSITLNKSDTSGMMFDESVSREKAEQLQYSLKVNQWVASFDWPMNQDYIAVAYDILCKDFEDFKLADLIEVGSKLSASGLYKIEVSNEFKTLENDTHTLRYRVRRITQQNTLKEVPNAR